MTSETCGTSSSAATRGIRSLPKVVVGPEHVRKRLRQLHDLRRQHRRERMLVGGVIELQYFAYPCNARRLRGDCAAIGGEHGDRDLERPESPARS